MAREGSIYTAENSPVRQIAQAISWLWRLGPVLEEPSPSAVGLGWPNEAPALRRMIRSGELAGAIVFAPGPGPDVEAIPGRGRRVGVADFGDGNRVKGQFTCFTEGNPAARSSLGVHAVRDDNWLVLGCEPSISWGALDGAWAFSTIAEFLAATLDRPLILLPAIGWVRYDDMPGNGFDQLRGKARSDRDWQRRIERMAGAFEEANAVLNVAVSARAFADEKPVPLEAVWPDAIAKLREGIERGVLEPLCHGYLHLDTAKLKKGELEPREFADMGAEEAEEKLDAALSWMQVTLGKDPSSFIAPNWAYGPGIREALANRGLTAWLPPQPGPLLEPGAARESLISTLAGMAGLSYAPLGDLAGAGYPPTVVVHGRLFDGRSALSKRHDLPTLARLFFKRDLFRVPWARDVRWVGASELLERMRQHDRIEVVNEEIRGPAGATGRIWDRNGVRPWRSS